MGRWQPEELLALGLGRRWQYSSPGTRDLAGVGWSQDRRPGVMDLAGVGSSQDRGPGVGGLVVVARKEHQRRGSDPRSVYERSGKIR